MKNKDVILNGNDRGRWLSPLWRWVEGGRSLADFTRVWRPLAEKRGFSSAFEIAAAESPWRVAAWRSCALCRQHPHDNIAILPDTSETFVELLLPVEARSGVTSSDTVNISEPHWILRRKLGKVGENKVKSFVHFNIHFCEKRLHREEKFHQHFFVSVRAFHWRWCCCCCCCCWWYFISTICGALEGVRDRISCSWKSPLATRVSNESKWETFNFRRTESTFDS